MLAPTSKRSDRLAQLATNAMGKRNKNSEFMLLRSNSSIGDVAIPLINITYLMDALNKAKVISEAETSSH
jgi:hypothetical protein